MWKRFMWGLWISVPGIRLVEAPPEVQSAPISTVFVMVVEDRAGWPNIPINEG
jgi:hypothetical protein